MAVRDAELEQQLKDVGKQLSNPPDSVDELLHVLDKLEKLLLKVDQSPKKSMVDALKPAMNLLIEDGLLKHSDMDVKVSVASCISEITRITAPDAPYTDDQMRDVFQLIVSSFEDIADRSSRSYDKRASILETVSKVRSCVIMLDLECDELIVKMFEHFLKSVRDYHLDSVYSSMENIMVLVIEESEEISVEMLKPLLATVKKDRVGVLPVAHKLGKEVLLKSAEKLKPYMKPALTSLGESLDMYPKVVAAVCQGTTAKFENNDDNDSELLPAKECKLEKGSVDEPLQADRRKVTTASSDHVDQVAKEEVCPEEKVDPTVENKSPKPVMSNGVNVMVKEEASVNQESKKPEEDKSQEPHSKEDTVGSDADKLANEKSETEKTSKLIEKKSDTVVNSAEPSDSSHVEGDKEIERDNDFKKMKSEIECENDVKESDNQIKKDNDVKESENEAAIPSKTENDKVAVQELPPKAIECKQEPTPQEDETASPSESGPPPDETRVKEAQPKDKGLTQEDTPEAQKQAEKNAVISKEVKLPVVKSEDGGAGNDSDAKPLKKSSKSTKQELLDTVNKPEDGEASSDSDAKPLKKSSKTTKQELPDAVNKPEDGEAGSDSDAKPLKKSSKTTKHKLPDTVNKPEDGEAGSDSDTKPLKKSSKTTKHKLPNTVNKPEDGESSIDSDVKPMKLSAKLTKESGKKSKQSGKKLAVGESDAKKPKPSGKKVDVKGGESDSDAKPLKISVKKVEKSKVAAEEDKEHDSDDEPLKLSAKKNTSKKKDDGKKRGSGKDVAEKDQAKSPSGHDDMDISPKSATKSAKGERNMTETPGTSAKRKRSTGKEANIKYDESLVGTKVKVWWPEDKMYYEGVVTEFYPAKKKHKVSYVDGDEEKLNLKTQRWEILQEFSVRGDKEQNAEAQIEEASPEIHKKKKSKTDPAVSQEKIKDSAKRVGGVSSSGKSKVSTPKDNTKKTSGKSSDGAATTSKETEKSEEDEETLKTSSKTKMVNKSKSKTTPSGSKSNTSAPTKAKSGSSKVKEPEDAKSTENTKDRSKKRKKGT